WGSRRGGYLPQWRGLPGPVCGKLRITLQGCFSHGVDRAACEPHTVEPIEGLPLDNAVGTEGDERTVRRKKGAIHKHQALVGLCGDPPRVMGDEIYGKNPGILDVDQELLIHRGDPDTLHDPRYPGIDECIGPW